jgi:hypothetical protein
LRMSVIGHPRVLACSRRGFPPARLLDKLRAIIRLFFGMDYRFIMLNGAQPHFARPS